METEQANESKDVRDVFPASKLLPLEQVLRLQRLIDREGIEGARYEVCKASFFFLSCQDCEQDRSECKTRARLAMALLLER